jgi:CheY-like chemotaxis protein
VTSPRKPRSVENRPLPDAVSKRVLVADRDEIVLALTRHVLTRDGHTVDVVRDAASVDERLTTAAYDVILLDAGIGAPPWTRALLSASPSTRIVAMTMDGDADDLPYAARIRKPLVLDELSDVIVKPTRD